MNIAAFAGCAIVVCVLITVLKSQRQEFGVVASIGAGVLLLSVIVAELAPIVDDLTAMLRDSSAGTYAGTVFKGLGICILSSTAADICRDSGQQTAASNVESAGRVAMLLLAMPLLADVLAAAAGIIEGQGV